MEPSADGRCPQRDQQDLTCPTEARLAADSQTLWPLGIRLRSTVLDNVPITLFISTSLTLMLGSEFSYGLSCWLRRGRAPTLSRSYNLLPLRCKTTILVYEEWMLISILVDNLIHSPGSSPQRIILHKASGFFRDSSIVLSHLAEVTYDSLDATWSLQDLREYLLDERPISVGEGLTEAPDMGHKSLIGKGGKLLIDRGRAFRRRSKLP